MWELDHKEGWASNIDAFELWSWRRLLRVPWTARRSNQSILKEINPEYSLEGLMLKLMFQYLGHLMWRANALEKTWILGKLKAGRERDNREWEGWIASLTQWTWVWVSSKRWWRTGKPSVLQSMGSQRAGQGWATEKQQVSVFLVGKWMVFLHPVTQAHEFFLPAAVPFPQSL